MLEIWKGNEAFAEAAIRAGCDCYFGYPITPQNEIPEYMSVRMPELGKVFVQAESEVSAINMVYGAAASGKNAMTSSSSPGMSLKQEGISYLAGANLPAVILNVARGGPGLGSIQASQGDYFQATRGGGNGDYRTPTLAPYNIQEGVDLIQDAFRIANKYRTPVVVLIDGLIGQMMEPVEWKENYCVGDDCDYSWAASGRGDRKNTNFITSLFSDPKKSEEHNYSLDRKYYEIKENEIKYDVLEEGSEIYIVAYGTPARMAETAIKELKEEGYSVGLFRPISLWPFPYEKLNELAQNENTKGFLTVELSLGQMIDDVSIGVKGLKPVEFYGVPGGGIIKVSEIKDRIKKMLEEN